MQCLKISENIILLYILNQIQCILAPYYMLKVYVRRYLNLMYKSFRIINNLLRLHLKKKFWDLNCVCVQEVHNSLYINAIIKVCYIVYCMKYQLSVNIDFNQSIFVNRFLVKMIVININFSLNYHNKIHNGKYHPLGYYFLLYLISWNHKKFKPRFSIKPQF